MGVNGLWKLLEPVGRPVSLEALERKTLAVDISVWLNQALYGMRNQHGSTISNAHLVLLFQRICKLLFFRIKPIFVFDGGVPELKKRTLATRKELRLSARRKASTVSHKVLRNYIKSHVIGSVTGNASSKSAEIIKETETERDLFELPPLPEDKEMKSSSEDESFTHSYLQDVESVNIDSEDFKKLTPEVQHEIIVEMHEKSKRHSRYQAVDMPEECNDFSNFQLAHLLKRGKLTQRLGTIRKEMNEQRVGELALNLEESGMGNNSVIESQKIISEDSGHYILIKRSEGKKKQDDEDDPMAGGFFRDGFANEPVVSDVSTARRIVSEKSEISCALTEQGSSSDGEDSVVNDPQDDAGTSSCGIEIYDLPKSTEEGAASLSVPSVLQAMDIEKSNSSDEKETNTQASDDTVDITDGNIMTPSCLIVEHSAVEISENSVDKNDTSSTEESCSEKSDIPGSKEVLVNTVETRSTVEELDIDDFEDEIQQKKLMIEKLLSVRKLSTQGANAESSKKQPHLAITSESIPADVMELDQTVSASSEPVLEETRHAVNEFQGMSHEDLEEMQERLHEDLDNLQEERSRQNRLAATVSDEMYKDSQDLLQLFGIPFVVSPMEAEAQCATLNTQGLCEGSITEDSDIVLFGGRKVYKNMFNKNKNAEVYQEDDIKNVLGLDRHSLITIALLTGSDYTEGVQGVGSVSAMEVIQEFSGDGIDKLRNLKNWWNESSSNSTQQSKLKKKLKNITFPVGFPSQQVYDAYLNPVVDDSSEAFSWGKPDLHGLRLFASEKLGWSKAKADEVLLPVLKRLNSVETQTKIDAFFPVQFNESKRIKSRRVKQVVNRLLNKELDELDDTDKPGPRKRRKPQQKKSDVQVERPDGKDDILGASSTKVKCDVLQIEDSTDSTSSDTSEEEISTAFFKKNVARSKISGGQRQRHNRPSAKKRTSKK